MASKNNKKKGKKKSHKGKSKKQLKKGKKKLGKKKDAKKKLEKKKSDKKPKKDKKSKKGKASASTLDTTRRVATLDGGANSLTAITNEVMPSMQTAQSTDDGNYGTNNAVFEWDGANWSCVEDNCNYGCIPQTPSESGTFPGDRTVTACVATVEGMACPPSE